MKVKEKASGDQNNSNKQRRMSEQDDSLSTASLTMQPMMYSAQSSLLSAQAVNSGDLPQLSLRPRSTSKRMSEKSTSQLPARCAAVSPFLLGRLANAP